MTPPRGHRGIRIGINPLTWTNDDLPELGEQNSLETCLSEAKLAGYDGVELGRKFPRDAATLGPILKQHGLALVSGWYSARLLERSVAEEISALNSHLNLLKKLNSKAMVFAEVSRCVHGDRSIPLSRRPKLSEADWKRLCKGLDALAAHLAGQGLALAYHHHMGTVIESEDEIDRMMAGTSSAVGLLLDTGHLTFAGGDPLRAARRHAARIMHVHCKDVRRDKLAYSRDKDLSFLDAVLADAFAVPGDGSIDFAPVLEHLARQGYRGWLVVEADQDPARAHPLTHARIGHDYLRSLARKYWG
jgi:inosose dehydratase